MKKIELLAPAQNKECALAAINFGADSVYIGANMFGARQNAKNSIEDIEEIVQYAHKFGVKIYVTLNTILKDKELEEGVKIIARLDEIGVDGVIIQDMGILWHAINEKFPEIKLIASTQCDIRSIEKVKFFENLGIKRVILARELSLKQIEEISKNSNIEIETFVHGALCVSYSGQCYLSYANGGRSANRGECAQCCRKKYTLVDKNGKILAKDKYLLSLKDFRAENKLNELIDAGVTSFKIEGRLKDVNYVKNVVGAYRKAIDKIIEKREDIQKSSLGKINFDFEPNVEKSFNRGFCEYFLEGKRGEIYNFNTPKSMGEYIGKVVEVNKNSISLSCKKGVKIKAQDGLCFIEDTGFGLLVNSVENSGDKIKIFPAIKKGEQIKLPKIGQKVYRNRDIEFEDIIKKSKTARKIEICAEVNKGVVKFFDNEGNLAEINFNEKEVAKSRENAKKMWEKALRKTSDTIFEINKINFSDGEIYFLPIAKMNEIRRKGLFELEDLRVKNYKREKQEKIKYAKYPVETGDFRLNVLNKKAEEFYLKCGLKVNEEALESRKTSKAGKELMRTKHCIRFALDICLKNKGVKNEDLFLIDETGAKYPLLFDCKNCEMVLLSNVTKK